MRRNILIFFILILFAISACDQFAKKKPESPFEFVPANASLVLETNNFLKLWSTYSKSNVWGLTADNEGLKHIYENLGSLEILANENPLLNKTLRKQKVLFGVIEVKKESKLIGIFHSEAKVNDIQNLIHKKFNDQASFSKVDIPKVNAYKVIFSDQKDLLFIAFKDGNIIASYSKEALKQSLINYQEGTTIAENRGFKKIRQTSGKYTDASLYVNFRDLHRLIESPDDLLEQSLIKGISDFASWGALDVTAKKNRVLLNGFVSTDTTKYLSVFKKKPQHQDFKSLLPHKSALILTQFFSKGTALEKTPQKQKERVKALEKRYNLKQNLYPYTGKNILLAITADEPNEISDHTFTYIHTTETEKAFEGLRNIAGKMKENYYQKKYQGYEMIQIPSDSFFPQLLGSVFSEVKSPFFLVHEDFLIGCPDKDNLAKLVHQLEDGKSLAQNDIYQSASSGITSESNLAIFIDINKALKLLPNRHPLRQSAIENNSFFESLNGFSLEFTAADELYFSSVFLNTGEKLRMSSENNWNIDLEAKMVGRPYIVDDHLSSEKRIIAFDALNNMYFINHRGEILWQHMLSGRPMSKVYEVDAYKNNKVQYLLNTESHIYLIDVLGRDVGDFPVELESPATNGIALFDYTGNKHYRILVAGSDSKIYNYTIEGKLVEGWKTPSMDGKVSKPLQHLTYGRRDYIFVADENGQVKIVNRRGEERIAVTDNFRNGINSGFYVNRTNDKAPFITSNQNGTLTYLNGDGSTNETSFDTFSAKHHFFYERFNEDAHYDFIYFDKNRLVVYDRFKKNVLEKDFSGKVITEPHIRTFKDDKAVIFTSLSEERLYLVTNEGVNPEINRLEGTTLFDMGTLKRFGKTSVIVGKDEKLFKYLID